MAPLGARLRRAVLAALFAALVMGGAGAIIAADAVVLAFDLPGEADGVPPGWESLAFRKIPRHTRYTVVRDGDDHVLRAESEAAASGLYRPLDLDPRVYRFLS